MIRPHARCSRDEASGADLSARTADCYAMSGDLRRRRGEAQIRIGFACHWTRPRTSTWSGTPANLLTALSTRANVVDLPAEPPDALRHLLRAVYMRPTANGLRSRWQQSDAADRWHAVRLSQLIRSTGCEVVLQIHDLAQTKVPYFVYQDLSYDIVLRLWDNPAVRRQFDQFTRDDLLRRRDRQRRIYAKSEGIIAMSRWFADSLIDDSEVAPHKVVAIHPGASSSGSDTSTAATADAGPRKRLLFVGKDFQRKGGDCVVGALRRLRAEYDPDITLTVAGPSAWPLPGSVPEGVTFLGLVPSDRVARLMDEHDVFMLPSRFEAFGIVIAEALARGLPCVGHRAFAMTEMIQDGRNGRLVQRVTTDEVTEAVVDVLEDEEMSRRCRDGAEAARRHYSWARAGEEVLLALRQVGSRPGIGRR